MATGTFAAAINCIDGRVQAAVADWMKVRGGVSYVDVVTYPGPDRALTQGPQEVVESLRNSVGISVRAHGSRLVAVAGHHDCAAYPASREEHHTRIREAMAVVERWGLGVQVVGLYVNDWWQVELVAESGAA